MSQCFYGTRDGTCLARVCTGTKNIIPRVKSSRSIIFIHFLATMLDYENEGFASRARYPGSERVRGWSRVAGIRAASLCALWPRRHPTETPRVEPRAGSTATGYRLQFRDICLTSSGVDFLMFR